jgi:hypothetical protein
MDAVRNPFAPGAGSQPPELAGRDEIIQDADIALQRVIAGRPAKSQILLGLRGTGKTVLLNKIEQMAEAHHHVVSSIEAPDGAQLAELLYPRIHQALRKISMVEGARAKVLSAMRALRAFASVFKVSIGDVSIAVDPEPGVADSGRLEFDLAELFQRVGEAAKSAGVGWTILIDEIQYLDGEELAALIVAMHRMSQRALPVIFFGAGLPQVAALSGDAKSYAERLFNYPHVGALNEQAAYAALRQPIEAEGETISEEALQQIFSKTQGYPYFLQEWGFQVWNKASASPIGPEIVEQASAEAIRRLDQGFFRVRLDRLTPKERDYVLAMASLGDGPYRSADVADKLGEDMGKLGPRRAGIIRKGMIYSPAHGDIAFTVPMFNEFLRRAVIST